MSFLKPALAVACLAVSGSVALAAGSGSSTPPKPTATTTECRNGQIYDEKSKTCVDARESGLSDDQRYLAARELAYAGQYENALNVLAAATDQDDPRILNYKGFAHRKAGRVEIGMAYYRAALEIDPDYILARSYMGQALAEQGDFAAARAELLEIRERGGRDSWAYMALRQALAGNSTNY